jgi:hypothetical protein
MKKTLLIAITTLGLVAACGPQPNLRAQYQQDCTNQRGTYQDEGGPDWAPNDAECLVPTASGRIIEIEYGYDD